MSMRKRSRNVALGASFTALAATLATGAAGCASSNQVTYCGNEQRYIVEATECEKDDSSYFIYYGYWGDYRYAPGAQLSQNALEGRVKANDPTARTKIGLPPRGGFGGNGAKFSSGG